MQGETTKVRQALEAIRCSAADSEEALHVQVIRALEDAGLDVRHEVSLGPRCRIDFMVGAVGIEVKKNKPVRSALIRQVTRYVACAQVEALIVIAPRGVDLPRTIGGKPVTMMALERLWGIALP